MIFPTRTFINNKRFGTLHLPICVWGCFLLAVTALAGNVYPITWQWDEAPDAAEIRERFPWIRLGPERVNIDLSLDGGQTWQELARGVESKIGVNNWYFNLPDDPAYFSSDVKVRVSSIPAYRRIQQQQVASISIAGIHLIDPPSIVSNGQDITLRWVSSGAGPLVTLGTRVIGAERFVPQAVFASQDSNAGAITNTATWSVSGLQSLPTEIILQSLAQPLNYRRHALEVQP